MRVHLKLSEQIIKYQYTPS